MKDQKVTMSKYVWAGMAAAFFLILGSVWFGSSSVEGVRTIDEVNKPGIPAAAGRGSAGNVVTQSPDPIVSVAPENPVIISDVSSVPQRPNPQPPKKITPRDMFPVGNITQNLPAISHPYRQVAELFPSFEYEGTVWSATGKYVRADEVDLTPTGYALATGQKLYALANTASPDAVLFVRSSTDPSKFAVYRRI